MTTNWIETIAGSLEDKKHYKLNRARLEALPGDYRTAAEAVDRYVVYSGLVVEGDAVLAIMDDLVARFEQAAATGTPVAELVGPDPVAFAETFLVGHEGARWQNPEERRFVRTMARATAGAR